MSRWPKEKLLQQGPELPMEERTTFFSMESVYGARRPNESNNRQICYSRFPGVPQYRGHPIVVID